MKRNLLKVAFAALCLLGIQSFTGMSQIMAEDIILRPCDPSDPKPEPHRAPQQSVVPAVEINDACDELTFTGSASISAQISRIFTFVEESFGDGNEMLLLVTELTVNREAAKFIAEHGCEEYYRYNKRFLLYERNRELADELAAFLEREGLSEELMI